MFCSLLWVASIHTGSFTCTSVTDSWKGFLSYSHQFWWFYWPQPLPPVQEWRKSIMLYFILINEVHVGKPWMGSGRFRRRLVQVSIHSRFSKAPSCIHTFLPSVWCALPGWCGGSWEAVKGHLASRSLILLFSWILPHLFRSGEAGQVKGANINPESATVFTTWLASVLNIQCRQAPHAVRVQAFPSTNWGYSWELHVSSLYCLCLSTEHVWVGTTISAGF